MKISEIIIDKYKLRMPPTVYYELLADVLEAEEEQEQKTGHWISREGNGQILPFWGRYECSECGECAENNNYCPNCGAEMKGGAE